MAGYPHLLGVTDPATQKALKKAFDDIRALQTQLAELRSAAVVNSATLNANGQRLSNLGAPTQESDAVTVSFLRQYVQAQVDTF